MREKNPPPLWLAVHRAVLATERGPLRPLWRLAYAALARAYAGWLRGGDRRHSVYVRGGPAPIYGLSDVDLAVVAAADPRGPGLARERVLARRERLCRALPWLCATLLDSPYVVEEDELRDAGTPAPLHRHALYFGARAHADLVRLAENPGLHGQVATWRRLSGPERRRPQPVRDPQESRVAAWLEMQARWRWFLPACAQPPGPRGADLCVKAIADPAGIWLWLAHGERATSRVDALERALRRLPEEEAALRFALALQRALPQRPDPPLEEACRHLVGLTARVVDVLTTRLGPAGTTEVRLRAGELVQRRDATFRLAPLVDRHRARVLPLADWRALVRASLRREGWIQPALPDETIAPLDLDPARLGELRAAVRAGDDGPYPALRAGGVLVLASVRWPRTQLRAVHCPLSDPVSFALLDGQDVARYPNGPGWSAPDVAGRAVAEHAAWLCDPGGLDPGDALAMLFTAARAALFQESLAEGDPALALTVSATADALRDRARSDALDVAEAAYREFRVDGTTPPPDVLAGLRTLVSDLPAYRAATSSSASRSPTRLTR